MREMDPRTAREALDTVERRHRQIAAEIGVPDRYWALLAGGWVVVGVLADVGNVVIGAIATLAFGALHSALAPALLSGRHKRSDLSVRADIAGQQLRRVVLAWIAAMVIATIAVALALDADGTGHAATVSAVIVALAILALGPRATEAWVRSRTGAC